MSDIEEENDIESSVNSENESSNNNNSEDDDFPDNSDDDDDSILQEGGEEDDDADEEGNMTVGAAQDDDDEQDEDVQEDDDNYLEKFERDVNKNYVDDFHPECIAHNFEEVAALCVVSRDDNCIINDKLHKTIPFLTKYERARVLGQRAKQIEYGDTPLVPVESSLIESHIIAEMELEARKIPFIIKRPIPGGGFEYWRLGDLELIAF
jgi:DNA-directed RNA polymerase I, II, and III subunit RPABC2